MEVLLNYPYPGNVRELENILEHALIICQGKVIRSKHLPIAVLREAAPGNGPTDEGADAGRDLRGNVAEIERGRIVEALRTHQWNRQAAARSLNINRTTLWRKMKKYRISR
jgi:transcriptional regulator with PAS, ATPase and Fis domain